VQSVARGPGKGSEFVDSVIKRSTINQQKMRRQFARAMLDLRSISSCNIRQLQTSTTLKAFDLEENELFASVNSPFIYCESDVNHHRQAIGQNPNPISKSEFPAPPPHALFGLMPAQHGVISSMRRLAKELDLDLSTLKLTEHFARFKKNLPGSGTLISRTRLRDVADSFDNSQSNIIIEVETWSSEANLEANQFLMFNQFCYSYVKKVPSDRKKFSTALKKRSWPPMMDMKPTITMTLRTTMDRVNYLSKIGRQNRFPSHPDILSLCSWKQDQFEGVGIINLVVENIINTLDIKIEKVEIIKTGLLHSVSPGQEVVTRVWRQDGPYGENYGQIFFESTIKKSCKPVINGAYILFKK